MGALWRGLIGSPSRRRERIGGLCRLIIDSAAGSTHHSLMNAAKPPRTQQRRPPHLGVAALALLVAGLSVFGRRPRRPVGNQHVPEPAKAVEMPRYLGLWYEFARYETWFERGCEAVTAEYRLMPDGRLSVINTWRRGARNGRLRWARARGKVVPNTQGAKLKIAFFGPFYIGNYWVLDHADDYAWSIIGEPTGMYLWILTRDPVPGAALAESLIGRARSLGYDTTILRRTRQPPEP
jgi:apolipoprotein D and lipocalin family protein